MTADDGGHHHRRRAGRADLALGPEDRRSDSAPARDRAGRRRNAPTSRSCYDRDHLYVGVVAYDSEPQRVIGTQMARDASLAADDRVEILLDTFRDQRSAFYFATNPSGALRGRPGREWTVERRLGRHLGRAHQTHGPGMDRGVRDSVQEPELPGRPDRVGLQHRPHIYRKLEEDRWSGARLDTQFFQVSEAGEITNLVGPDAGDRPRRPAVPRGALAARRRRGRRQRQAGPRRVLQHHAQPEADRDLQHRLRRNGSRRAPDQPLALLGALSGEALVLPGGRGRLQLRQHRARSRRAAFPRPAPTSIRSSAGRSVCWRARRCRSMPASS